MKSVSRRVLLLVAALAGPALADPPAVSYPAWWIPSVAPAQPSYTTQPEYEAWLGSHYAPANLGQLKNFAKQAEAYLDTKLSLLGGAGPDINTLVAGFAEYDEGAPAANYAALNLGQLKYVAKKFYDRLLAVGFDTNASLRSRGYPVEWTGDYPWNPATAVEANYAPANLGQLKLVFAFDLSATSSFMDTDSDGLPDWWERAFFGSLSQSATDNPDSDGSNNLQEYTSGTAPAAALTITITAPSADQEL